MLVMAHDEHGYGDVDNHGDHDGYIGHPDDQGPGRPVRERESKDATPKSIWILKTTKEPFWTDRHLTSLLHPSSARMRLTRC